MDFFSKILLGATQPERMMANILAQNYGPAVRGLTGGDPNTPGKFEQYVRSAITPEEQQRIDDDVWMETFKSAAGVVPKAMGFLDMTRAALPALQYIPIEKATELLPRTLQILGQSAKTATPTSFSYSRPGKELQDTGVGTALGMLLGLGGNLVGDKGYRKMWADNLSGDFKNPNITFSTPREDAIARQVKERSTVKPTTSQKSSDLIDQWRQKWGDVEMSGGEGLSVGGQGSLEAKVLQGGDKALNAESEWIGKVYNNLTNEKKLDALQRLDEIIQAMQDPGQKSQVVFLKKYLDVPQVLGTANTRRVEPMKTLAEEGYKKIRPKVGGRDVGYITQRMDDTDRKIMIDFIDAVRLRKKNVDAEIQGRITAEAMGLNPNVSNSKLAGFFENILEYNPYVKIE